MATQLSEFQKHAVTVALHKLLNGKHFCICDFQTIAKILECDVGGKDLESLRILHCVDYGVMGPELARMTREKVVELLGLDPGALEVLVPTRGAPVAQPAHEEPKKLRLAFWRQ